MNAIKGVIGFTAGNFDLLHPGYIYTFEEAKKHCDHFIVFCKKILLYIENLNINLLSLFMNGIGH